jgi:branched-chain amino acid transport system ATP-binding protein
MSTGLEIRKLVVERSGSTIVREVDMRVPPGEVTLLLGANGAGKTTLLEAISGLIPTAGGEALLDGTVVTKASRVRRSRNGLCHLEQGRTVFGDLTVAENVQAVARDPSAGSDALAMFPELEPRLALAAASLSGGEQQMLAIARALATRPSLLLVEQYADLAMRIGDTAYVLSRGAIALQGDSADLLQRPEDLRHAYLGGASAGGPALGGINAAAAG